MHARSWKILAALVLAPGAVLSITAATPAVTLYNFTGLNGDGGNPAASLVAGRDGILYGTTEAGGQISARCRSGCGTVFALTPPASRGGSWSETVLYEFAGEGGDGISPEGNVTIAPGGALYGTCYGGGANGFGIVFRMDPPSSPGGPWTETVLHSFSGAVADGAYPDSSVTLRRDGTLVGTTSRGGAWDYGTVFQLTPAGPDGPWNESVLYMFTGGDDGGEPYAGLISDSNGILYGTTIFGGLAGGGTVYELRPPGQGSAAWSESVLYSFTGKDGDGYEPFAALVAGPNGVLYGTTRDGGCICPVGFGIVFQLIPPAPPGKAWTERIIHTFMGGTDGENPIGTLALGPDGVLYGTTIYGGDALAGTIFKLVPPASAGGTWTESLLYSFRLWQNGFPSNPVAGPTLGSHGVLYGTTYHGGTSGASNRCGQGCGAVFALVP